MRVVNIINNLEIGGAEKALITQIKSLQKYSDVDQIVISLEGHGPLEEEILKLGVEYKKFNYNLFRPLFQRFDIFVRPRLLWYLLKMKPDILHGHLVVGEDIAKVSGAILGIPVINTVHDVFISPSKKRKFINRYLSKTVAVSEGVKSYLTNKMKISEDKIVVIPNAIDFIEYGRGNKVFDKKHPVFLYFGRIWKDKGLKYAIYGLSKVSKFYPKMRFLIYGKEVHKEDLAEIKEAIKSTNANFVELMGVTNDVVGALALADIFILPSKSEGFSIAALESAAAKKPLIATKVGILDSLIVEGETGYFINYGSAESVAEKALLLLNNNVNKMGETLYDKAKDLYSVEVMGRGYYTLYKELYGKKYRHLGQ